MRTLLVLTLAAAAGTAACAGRQVEPVQVEIAPAGDPQLSRIAEAVTAALTARPPDGKAAVPRTVRLQAVERRRDGAIVLGFTNALLLDTTPATLEDVLGQLLTAAATAAGSPDPGTRFLVLVEGVAVDSYRLTGPVPGSS